MGKTDFFKVSATGRQDQTVKLGDSNYLLVYGYGTDDSGEQGYNWRRYYDHRPTEQELREDITALVNGNTDAKILTGFEWDGNPVYLSAENQMNFKAAYDLAVQTDGAALPVKFKLGEDADGNPVYHTFGDLEEFADFYTKAMAFIQEALNEGWEEKDSVDYRQLAGDE